VHVAVQIRERADVAAVLSVAEHVLRVPARAGVSMGSHICLSKGVCEHTFMQLSYWCCVWLYAPVDMLMSYCECTNTSYACVRI